MRSVLQNVSAGSKSRRLRWSNRAFLALFASLMLATTALVVASITSETKNPNSLRIWREHHERCLTTPDGSYQYDRFRAIKGRITDPDGKPVTGAMVRCSRVMDLSQLAKIGDLSDSKWVVPIHAEMRAASDGRYSFPHLPLGAYTFFYSAPGLGPAVKDLIVVQDGLGAVLDITLEQPRTLRVHPDAGFDPRSRLSLVPYRWWPELPAADIDPATGKAEFADLGGPFRQGLIVATSGSNAWRVVGRYDLNDSEEAAIGPSPPASILDLGEAARLEPWGDFTSPEFRSFYAAMSPIALLWGDPTGDGPFVAAMADFVAKVQGDGVGSARGFGPHPFLPLLIESRAGIVRLGWASDSSEFTFPNLSVGPHRVRSLDLFGKPTFDRGFYVAAGATAKLAEGIWTKPDFAEANSREIMGFVRWEGGLPASRAVVFVQHRGNFRLYLRRVEADENGFFRVSDVPGDEMYFAFAVPPGEDMAARQFTYFKALSTQREVWCDLTLHGHRVVGQLAGFILSLGVVPAASWSRGRRPPLPDGIAQAGLCFFLTGLLPDLMPRLGSIGAVVSGWVARYNATVGGVEADPSFVALGGPPVMFASIYLLWRWRAAGGVARLVAATVLPPAWFATTAAIIPDPSAGALAAFGRGSLHGASWMAIAILVDAFLPAKDPRHVPRRKGALALLGVACLAATLAGICLAGTSLLGPNVGRRVLVHNRGGLDWDRPVFGRFGVFNGGMFGLLPAYCRAEGYDFGVIDKDSVGPDDLAGAQVLILINSPKSWPEAERRVVFDFVERGGSLLVLGDHTDVFGLMRGFNGLLNAFGIQFRFDSAYKARDTWRGCQVAAPDAIAWGWDAENPSVAVGASLELSGSARPLLTGRYGFSDAGIRENYAGSFLGNYRYDQGEKLGDVVLVATATRGQGRVVVWGDTSAFQGGLSASYAKVVGPMLAWLSRPAAWTERPPARILAAAVLVATIMGLWLARATAAETAAIAASLLLGMLATWALSLPNLDSRVTIANDAFIIDGSHLPASGHYEAHVNPVGPLYTNLFRCGFRVVDRDDWDSSVIARARGIAFVAPQRSFSSGEVDDLLRAEEAGATVLLAVGQPDSAASRPLLQAHGLALAPRPLGMVTASDPLASFRDREKEPRFLDAWPITTIEAGDPTTLPGVEVIYRRGEDVIALFQRRGRGGLLLISDTRFFSDMNVEGMAGNWLGNLALIHDVLVRYAGAKPDDVKPLFRSPEKPQ